MITSFAFSLVGFGLWLVDVHGCHILRNMRAVLGHPWIALLQLHAWWHLLTSLGATWLIAALTLADPFQSPQFYVEPYGFIFPITCRTQVPTEIIAIRHKIE
jgi:dihydroceramidase